MGWGGVEKRKEEKRGCGNEERKERKEGQGTMRKKKRTDELLYFVQSDASFFCPSAHCSSRLVFWSSLWSMVHGPLQACIPIITTAALFWTIIALAPPSSRIFPHSCSPFSSLTPTLILYLYLSAPITRRSLADKFGYSKLYLDRAIRPGVPAKTQTTARCRRTGQQTPGVTFQDGDRAGLLPSAQEKTSLSFHQGKG